MKRVLSLLLVLLLTLVLAACNGDTDATTTTKTTQKETSGETTEPTTTEPDEEEYNLNGIDFVIMCDNKNSCDPRSDQYKRLFRQEKIDRIKYVEEKYNVNVVYETYPSQASWGGARQRWIIEQTTLGNSPAHIYEIQSSEIANLAVQGAILPLDDLIQEYGSPHVWPEALEFGKVEGKYYSYHDNYPVADYGIYYNADLLDKYLGASRRHEPTTLWLEGKWDWEAFEKLADELNSLLDENRPAEDGGPQYVLGGRTYNWAYQMIGANGGHLIDGDFNLHLTTDPVIDTLDFLNDLYEKPGMWIDDAPLSNASQPGFKDGNIAFHNGQSWWIFQDNKWLNRDFEIGFVPYPTGNNTKKDLSNYYVLNSGIVAYVISAAFSKDLIPPGYENLMLHDEIIFKIWHDLQYFPDVDPDTGYSDIKEYADEFYFTRLFPYYGDEASREAHLDIFTKSSPEYFTTFSEAIAHTADSWMIAIQQAIREGDVRNEMISLEEVIKPVVIEKYGLPDNYYDN